MEKNIKLNKDTVSVTLKLASWKPGVQKVRYYEASAREWVQEKHPNIQLGKTLKPDVVRNQGPITEGEWIFEVVQEKKELVITVQEKKEPITKKKATIKKKEVVDAEDPNGTN